MTDQSRKCTSTPPVGSSVYYIGEPDTRMSGSHRPNPAAPPIRKIYRIGQVFQGGMVTLFGYSDIQLPAQHFTGIQADTTTKGAF